MKHRFLLALFSAAAFFLGCWARQPVSAPPEEPPVIALAAIGDVLLAAQTTKPGSLQEAKSPFAAVKPVLSGADIAFCNLECPLSDSKEAAEKKYLFRAPPASAAILRSAGIDVVSLANNHTLDYGRKGLLDTFQALQAEGISWVGAGEDLQEAQQPQVFSFGSGDNRTRVALLAYSNMLPTDFYATSLPGTAPALDSLIRKGVSEASQQADFVIVSFHWGDENSQFPGLRERTLARLAIDSGADVVLGCHPHVLQGIERCRGGLIAYSLGNFVFPSRGLARESAILLLRMQRPKKLSLEVIPVLIEKSAPRPARGAEAAKILNRLAALSGQLGTKLEIGADSAWLETEQ